MNRSVRSMLDPTQVAAGSLCSRSRRSISMQLSFAGHARRSFNSLDRLHERHEQVRITYLHARNPGDKRQPSIPQKKMVLQPSWPRLVGFQPIWSPPTGAGTLAASAGTLSHIIWSCSRIDPQRLSHLISAQPAVAAGLQCTIDPYLREWKNCLKSIHQKLGVFRVA